MKPSFIVVGLACILGAALPARRAGATGGRAAPGRSRNRHADAGAIQSAAPARRTSGQAPGAAAYPGGAGARRSSRARHWRSRQGHLHAGRRGVSERGRPRVPLIADATLLDAHIGTTSVPLVTEGPMAVALVEGPRPFTIALDWGGALSSSPGRASMLLPVPMAGSASLSLDLPGHPADVRIAPGVITRTTTAGDVTHVEATLVPGTRAALSWSSREATAPAAPQEARTMAEVKTMVSVGEVEMRMTALVEVTVLRGEPERFEVKLPPGFTATGASGSALSAPRSVPAPSSSWCSGRRTAGISSC